MIEKLAHEILRLQEEENQIVHHLKRQLEEVDKSISNIIDAVEKGMFSPQMKDRMDELQERKEDLEISIAHESIKIPMITYEQLVFWMGKFRGGDANDKAFRKRIVETFVNSVVLYDDKLVINYNYKDGTNTLTVDELKGSNMMFLSPPPA